MLTLSRYLLASFLVAAVLLTGCDDKQQSPQSGAAMTTVTYMTLKPRSVTLTTELPGRTAPYRISEVRPQVSGIVKARLFEEGTEVKAGDVLYQIDPALYRASYDNAKAALARAQASEASTRQLAARYGKLIKVNAISKQEYDDSVAGLRQSRADIAAAKAALDTARINLQYTKVTAPVSGRIDRSSVTVGALVTQNQQAALATVQQLDPIYVDVTQSSTELLRLRRAYERGEMKSSGEGAMQVTLKLEDGSTYTQRAPKTDVAGGAVKKADGTLEYEDKPVYGTLKFSEVTVDQSTGAVTIRVLFPNPDGTLLPGMYVRAVLEEGVRENALMVPRKAVIRNNQGLPVAQVLVKDPSGAQPEGVFLPEARMLTVDRAVGSEWFVTDGLQPGDRVLVEGVLHLRGKAPVKGIEAVPVKGAASPGFRSGDDAQKAAGAAQPASGKQ